jgi:hypothetical protein
LRISALQTRAVIEVIFIPSLACRI